MIIFFHSFHRQSVAVESWTIPPHSVYAVSEGEGFALLQNWHKIALQMQAIVDVDMTSKQCKKNVDMDPFDKWERDIISHRWTSTGNEICIDDTLTPILPVIVEYDMDYTTAFPDGDVSWFISLLSDKVRAMTMQIVIN